MIEVVSAKKKALLAYKEKLLNDINYHEKRIQQVRLCASQNETYAEDDGDSSESDTCLPQPRAGPSIRELELQRASLSVCLQATQELTSLQVLQSEVNVVVDAPDCDDKADPIDGTWREVTAECRADLVPFSITFFVHQPSGRFPAARYRALRVRAEKAAHGAELAKSVLHDVQTPSDAVQMIRSYALAYRSRRSTLARLAHAFPDALSLEAVPTGGFLMKCADVLSVSWTLQNKWSPIAAFMHRMKFELEYMDEAYLKEIKRAHSQLIDPSLETDERTHFLSKIIEICLEANRTQTESDTDTEGRARRTTLEAEPEMPQERKRPAEKQEAPSKKRKDSEVMAPPKQLPKKAKPKAKISEQNSNKENRESEQKGRETAAVGQKSKDKGQVKDSEGKISEHNTDGDSASGQKGKETAANGQKNKDKGQVKDDEGKSKENGMEGKDSLMNRGKGKENVQVKGNGVKAKESALNGQKGKSDNKVKEVGAEPKDNGQKTKDNENNVKEKVVSGQSGTEKGVTVQNIKSNVKNSEVPAIDGQKIKQTGVNIKKGKVNATEQSNKENTVKTTEVVKKNNGKVDEAKKAVKRPLESENNKLENHLKGKNVAKSNIEAPSKKIKITESKTVGTTKKVQNSEKVGQKEQHKKPNKIQENDPKKVPVTKNKLVTKKSDKAKETVVVEKMISGNIGNNGKMVAQVPDRVENIEPKTKTAMPAKTPQKTTENDKNVHNKLAKNLVTEDKAMKSSKIPEANKAVKSTKIPLKTAQSVPVTKPKPLLPIGKKGPSENQNLIPTSSIKMSKIPQKRLPTVSEKDRTRFDNPLRLSPRKPPSTASVGSKQLDAVRNSPRLLKKPVAKPKSMFTF